MKITFSSDEFRRSLSRIKSRMLTRIVMGKMAAKGVTLIFDRTVKEGKDKDGKPFVKYSRGYLDFKEGRAGDVSAKRKGKRKFFSGKPNLFDGGDMLGDLQPKVVNDDTAFIHLPKTSESLKASGHIHGARRLPKRDFFGLTTDEEKELLLIPESHLQKLIRDNN